MTGPASGAGSGPAVAGGAPEGALPNGTGIRGYVIEGLLGAGRLGSVYRARHGELDVTVVLEQWLPGRAGGATDPAGGEERERFLERARSLAGLRGVPGVVPYLDCFSEGRSVYLVAEHAGWPTLAETLDAREARGAPLGEAELLAVARPLLEGLREAHACGVRHGGIRPSLILVRASDLRPALVGFGSAEGRRGTAGPEPDGYAAPEAVGGGEPEASSDLYAIGAVLWRIVAGGAPGLDSREPPGAGIRMNAAIRSRPDPLEPASVIGSGRFSGRVLATIDSCLSLSDPGRPRDCAQVLELLAAAGGAEASPAAGSWRAAFSRASAAVMCVALALGAAVGLGLRKAQGPPPPARVAAFVLEADPAEARARLPGIGADYRPGMALVEGRYQVEVSADGYETKALSVEHLPGREPGRVTLEPSSAGRAAAAAALTVAVDPAHAALRFLGSQRRYTAGMELPEGEYRLEISAEGYDTRVLSLRHGPAPTVERVALRRAGRSRVAAAFTVEPQPGGARVRLLDIEEAYRAGMALPAGRYRVEVSAEGYRTAVSWVEHGERPTHRRIALRKLGPAFTVTPVPEGARVRLPGLEQGYRPGMRLPEGEYRIEVSAEGYKTVARSVRHGSEPTNELVELEPRWQVPASLEFVRIPAGEFEMGGAGPDSYEDERPATRVRIGREFELGRHEVTQGQWEAVMGGNPSHFAGCGRDCPVESVTWHAVQGFLERLNLAADGYRYRLPTEAEWEYAARGGAVETPLEGSAWWQGNSGLRTHPVGGKRPNGFGLHDTTGNVWEWVADRYGAYPGGAVTDPTGPASGTKRVVRGGGWNDPEALCRPAARHSAQPNALGRQIGFRLARSRSAGPGGGE